MQVLTSVSIYDVLTTYTAYPSVIGLLKPHNFPCSISCSHYINRHQSHYVHYSHWYHFLLLWCEASDPGQNLEYIWSSWFVGHELNGLLVRPQELYIKKMDLKMKYINISWIFHITLRPCPYWTTFCPKMFTNSQPRHIKDIIHFKRLTV